ncbi:glutamate-rich protein 2 isoform X1 [Pangasianodon hypophthalmus]|uniref:glutamate-rich protein 2 isoform X1 n=1 Tax=Pangasianodon hypophthalmus TaxID=310915 RepID=UPI000F008093|nr:glutamate-rich protein 2 isoform X1 [Pangasianodon hypophthalmus]
MSRLQCIGTSSKVPSQDAEAAEPGILSSRDAPVTKSVQAKTQLQKTKLRARPEGQQPSAITERRRDKGNVDKLTVDPETQSEQQENGFKKTKVKHRPSRSETQAGVQVLSPTDTTTHRQEQSHTETHSAPVGAEEKTVSSECVQKMREPLLQVPRCLGVPKCGAGRSSSEAESGDEEECEEEEEDADEFRAPIELLAEFLKAVMEKKYTLAKKLCQMILIYEPENPEAKHFLPLIEERLLIEEAQKGSSGEDDTSDDDDDDDDDDNDDDESSSSGSGDDDDDDDDTDTCTDSDGDGRKEEDISQR